MHRHRFVVAFLTLAGLGAALPAQTNVFPSTGNAGVGTTSPADKLQVTVGASDTGITLDDGGSNYNAAFTLARNGSPRLRLTATSQVGTIYGMGGNGLSFGGDNGTQHLFISPAGSVGIGTTSPSTLLYLKQTSVSNPGYNPLLGFGYDDSKTFGGTIGMRLISGNPRYGLKLSSNLNLTFHSPITTSNPAFQWQTGTVSDESTDANTVMTITGAGKVGIGTTSPQAGLHVYNSGGHIALFQTNQTGAGIRDLAFADSTGSVRALVGYDPSLDALQLGDTSGITLTSKAGNVGIGATAPNAKLEIQPSGVNVGLRLKNTGASINWDLYAYSDGNFYINNANGSVFNITSNAQANLLYLAGGNIGIGTSNPTQKLSVNGTIQAKEVIVQTGWSDYVFADDYRLAPLSEVESHIKAERHLPGIPSAAEVAEHGVSMGEMQSKLLAKIEELTLHQIEQEKELQALRAENKEILSRLKP